MAKKPRFKKTVLENGLTILTEGHPEFRSLSMGVWVKAGTRHERPREAGVSHFLEHMLFKGTESRSALQIAREVDQVGGEFNAFTAREHTCFHLLLLDRDLGLGLDILSDILLHSTFDPEELERERKVIMQEISMVEDSPEELVHDLFFEKLYGRHGLGRPILGTGASIRRMRRRDMVEYFRKHYRPDQLVFSVAGDTSHDSVVRKLRSLLKGSWPDRRKRETRKDLGFEPAPKIRHGKWWVERPTEQVQLLWGVEGPKTTSRDRFASLLLNVYLGGGMSSALFQEIREKNGLAYTVYSSMQSYSDSGVFSIYAATGPHQVPLCLKLMDECVHKLCATQLSDAELQTIKDNLKGTILLSSDSAESRMSNIAKNEMTHGRYVSADDVCKQIDTVTAGDIRRLARKLFGRAVPSIMALGPKPSRSVLTKLLK